MPRIGHPALRRILAACCSGAAAASIACQEPAADFAARLREHWAWQPLRDAEPPPVRDTDWIRDPLDAFVLARLEASGLAPAPPAKPEVWLRRVWFDLAGLPPPPSELAAFLADPSPQARERTVDALLASLHHAERFARHWLDLVRYAESLGHEYDFPIPNAWRYRDYVIRAIHHDVPFDQFGREHVAGDLMQPPRLDPATGADESVQATAFWWFAEQTHSPVDACQHQADRIDNQIDVLTKTFLGVTVACARCHDHKFDAIRSADYYALYGFLKSSRYVQQPIHRTAPAAVAAVEHAHRELAAMASRGDGAPASGCEGLRAGDELFADLGQDAALPHGWSSVGDAFGRGPWDGPFVLGSDETGVHLRELPGRFALSAGLGRDREGTLLSPTFRLEHPFVHVEAAGEGARVLLVLEGLHLVRDPIYGGLHRPVADPEPHWLTFDVAMWQGRSAHLQCVDQRAHDLADPEHNGGSWPADGWLAVRRVVFSRHQKPPPAPPKGRSSTLPHEPAVAAGLAALAAAQALLPEPATLPAMVDGTGEDESVFVRGNHKTRGPVAPRRFLEAIDGSSPLPVASGSGRARLAERMFAPDDPLPARVLVNRFWHHLFGQGIVRSVDNLGHLGDRPTHPDLLDRLAIDFMRDGFSQRRLLRRIVLSSTYGMSSHGAPEASAIDPDNALLHRQRLRRLQGEALRDALLCLADRLDPTPFGPPVPVSLHAQPKARGRPRSGPLDGAGRRSIYLAVQRNFLPDLLLAFDLPTPFATVGARNVSNVPAQALAMLNDPFVHAMCRLAGDHVVAKGAATDAARLDLLFRTVLCRRPSAVELDRCLEFLAEARAAEDRATEDRAAEDRATEDRAAEDRAADAPGPWAELVHALVNGKEFLHLQ